jgi:DNA-binding NarL/FixJ family response regulator
MRGAISQPTSVRLLIVDDHPIVRMGLNDLFTATPGMAVVGQAATVDEAMLLAAALAPDVAIVDLILGTEDGLGLVTMLAKRVPAMRILVLSSHDERLYAARALCAGARGYIMKDQPADELLKAVRHVAAGRPYVSAASLDHVLSGMRPQHAEEASPLDRLSNRERHVFALLGRGLATREIAEELNVSVKTVETHCAHLKEKLGARSGRELIRLAFGWADRR